MARLTAAHRTVVAAVAAAALPAAAAITAAAATATATAATATATATATAATATATAAGSHYAESVRCSAGRVRPGRHRRSDAAAGAVDQLQGPLAVPTCRRDKLAVLEAAEPAQPLSVARADRPEPHRLHAGQSLCCRIGKSTQALSGDRRRLQCVRSQPLSNRAKVQERLAGRERCTPRDALCGCQRLPERGSVTEICRKPRGGAAERKESSVV